MKKAASGRLDRVIESGRGERIRTSDPYNPIVVRYQAAPRPDRAANYKAIRAEVVNKSGKRAAVVEPQDIDQDPDQQR